MGAAQRCPETPEIGCPDEPSQTPDHYSKACGAQSVEISRRQLMRKSRSGSGGIAILTSTTEDGTRKKRLGLKDGERRRGWGFEPLPDRGESYSDSERLSDARNVFIEDCARLYMHGKLTERNPTPSVRLAQEIRRAGGNVRWISINVYRQRTFHYHYCRLRGAHVPLEKVWRRD